MTGVACKCPFSKRRLEAQQLGDLLIVNNGGRLGTQQKKGPCFFSTSIWLMDLPGESSLSTVSNTPTYYTYVHDFGSFAREEMVGIKVRLRRPSAPSYCSLSINNKTDVSRFRRSAFSKHVIPIFLVLGIVS